MSKLIWAASITSGFIAVAFVTALFFYNGPPLSYYLQEKELAELAEDGVCVYPDPGTNQPHCDDGIPTYILTPGAGWNAADEDECELNKRLRDSIVECIAMLEDGAKECGQPGPAGWPEPVKLLAAVKKTKAQAELAVKNACEAGLEVKE